MKILQVLAPAAIIGFGLWATSAKAAVVVLTDNFDTDTQTLNWTGDAVFNVVPNPPVGPGPGQTPSVDLIGTGFYDLYPGNGNYLDLDGSTGNGNSPAGEISSVLSFGPGSYVLTFDMGGNARGYVGQSTTVTLGSFSQLIGPLPSDTGSTLTPYSISFTTTTGGNLDFIENGPSDQQGNILDNIELVATPLPATWSMLLAGFAGLAFAAFRSRSGVAAAA